MLRFGFRDEAGASVATDAFGHLATPIRERGRRVVGALCETSLGAGCASWERYWGKHPKRGDPFQQIRHRRRAAQLGAV